jgi:thioredoxin-dependent peroxiredoxin
VFAQKKIEILGVSFDNQQANAAFAKKFSFPFPLLCDTSRELGLAYGACDDPKAGYAKRISYLIDEQGKILKAYPKVQPADHPEEVLRDAG